MKILLIQSYLGKTELPIYPISIASLLPHLSNHNVKALDLNVVENPFDELKKTVKTFQPDLTGISIRNIDSTNKKTIVFYYDYLKETISIIKEQSNSKIAAGGAGFSIFAREIMNDEPRIDYGFFLESENTFPKLLDNIAKPENVKSLFYRRDGEVLFTGAEDNAPAMDELQLPDRTLIPIDKYKHVPWGIGVETKRGCALNCIYCVYGFLNGKAYRLRPAHKVAEDIETLVSQHGVTHFTFIDSVFNMPRSHAENVCKELIRRKINATWSAWFIEKGFTRQFAELIKAAGCTNVILSPDALSNSVLKKLGKAITKDEIVETYNMLKTIGDIEISYNFFKNPPGQKFSHFLAVLLFCITAKLELRGLVHFEFNSLRIEPHTKLHQIALAEGVVSEEEESLLRPKYYTNGKTKYIEHIFNLLLTMKKRKSV
ncbi:Fe-S oxidoreductase [Candidatus Magnetoovum chiemensis]|nr:Fe-S oxidoreductase [Candidatus Magnetoovum chiemensis]